MPTTSRKPQPHQHLMKDRHKRSHAEPVVAVPQDIPQWLTKAASEWPRRFLSKVSITEGCWLWNACVTRYGYGRYSLGGRDGGVSHAYRVAYWLTYGPIATGMVVDHLCRVPGCVRPDHLELVTHAENLRRGRGSNDPVGTCRSGMHPWSLDNILTEPSGARRCRPCRDERERLRVRVKAVSA